MTDAPSSCTVSIIVPCRNEAAHIGPFVASALAQHLPAGCTMELIVADGSSDDGTRQRLDALAVTQPRLVVIDNPARIVSAGLNAAIARARGEVVVRMDVHTRYAEDYVAQCLAALARTGADNVGGPWCAVGETPWQRAIAAAFQSRWVAGGARSRDLRYEGEVDTVYLGCWPRASLRRWGGFDEQLVRNQDDEHNLRIVRGGGRVWQSAAIRSTYSPRLTVGALFRQWFQYGYWKPFVMRKHAQAAAARQVVPGALVAAWLLAVTLAALRLAPWALPGGLLGAYGLLVLAQSASVMAGGAWSVWWRVPIVVAVHQVAYGFGSLFGWWDVLRHGRGRERFAKLTR